VARADQGIMIVRSIIILARWCTKFGTHNSTNHGSYSVCASTQIESTENRVLFKRINFTSRLVLL
jgi:hypothetical protein